MAFDEHLADRLRQSLLDRKVIFTEKKMMGGLTFMVDDKMCLGIVKDELMARVGPDAYDEALQKSGSKEMLFTGRPMKGYVFIEQKGIQDSDELEYFIQLSLDFNPFAKSSKKKR